MKPDVSICEIVDCKFMSFFLYFWGFNLRKKVCHIMHGRNCYGKHLGYEIEWPFPNNGKGYCFTEGNTIVEVIRAGFKERKERPGEKFGRSMRG